MDGIIGRNVTLAHATWTKVHSNSADNGWRPFAPPANLTVVLDMNLGDKKLRRDVRGAWETAAKLVAPTRATSFPPLMYSYSPTRRTGDVEMLRLLNPQVAALHHQTCRWGGCHPSRGEASPMVESWQRSSEPSSQGSDAMELGIPGADQPLSKALLGAA